MKTIRLFLVAFVAMFMSASFSNHVSAQSNNDLLENALNARMMRDKDDLRAVGIVSLNFRIDGTVYVVDLVLDEVNLQVEDYEADLEYYKGCLYTGELLLDEFDEVYIKFLESQVSLYKLNFKGNVTGKNICKELTAREFYAYIKKCAPEMLSPEGIVNEVVAQWDIMFKQMNENSGCVRDGKNVYFEYKASLSEYDMLKKVVDENPVMYKTSLEALLTSDPNAAKVFKLITKRGYRFAYSIKCAGKQPIIINLDF